MPKVNWGIDAGLIDDFDRESQFAPYAGPMPPTGVYQWLIKVLKYAAPEGTKFPQLRVGLELVPRERAEEKYAGYFVMKFITISDNPKAAFNYVPFCDAIGVRGREFTRGTITDEEGNVRKIGNWRNTGDVLILGELRDGIDQNNNSRREIGWVGAALDEDTEDAEADEEEGF